MVTVGLLASMSWLAFEGLPLAEGGARGGVAAETASDRFEPRMQRDLVGFDDVDFDSGWLPMNAPVQLRFYAHAADSIEIEMLGDGVYDWDVETIAFEGDPGGGRFLLDVGLQLQASVRFDVLGLQWESDILGPWDYAITSEAFYTPYLLPGHPDSPVEIDDQTDGVPVASVPIVPDIIVASGNLDVSVAADITARLEGVRIEATTQDDGAIVDAWAVASPLSPVLGEDPLEVEGVLVADMQTAPVLIVRPHLVMSILGQDFEIFGIDIPIALPEVEEQLVFDPEAMLFDAPEPPPNPGSGGLDESGEGGGSGVGDGPGGEGETEGTGTAGETDSDGSGSGGIDGGSDGCGCRSTPPGPGGAAALLLVVLGLVRRSRA